MEQMSAIEKASKKLQSEIREKQEQLSLLKNFNNIVSNKISEEDFHSFCKTWLRNENCLGESLQIALPFLSYQGKDCNFFYYNTKDDSIDVQVPVYDTKCVYLVLQQEYKKFCEFENFDYNKDCKDKLLKEEKRIYNLIQADDIPTRASYAFPNFNKFFQLVCYGCASVVIDYSSHSASELKKVKKELCRYTETNEKEYQQYLQEQTHQQKLVNTYKDLLFQWTNHILLVENKHQELLFVEHFSKEE